MINFFMIDCWICLNFIIIFAAVINSKSRSTQSLANNNPINTVFNNNANNQNNSDQGFYQNLSVYRKQNQTQPILNER